MKKVSADFIRQEVTRFGAIVVQTSIFHPCGLQLHAAGDVLTLAHAKALRESFVDELALADFREDPRKALGIQQVPKHQVQIGDVLGDDLRDHRDALLLSAGTVLDSEHLRQLQDSALLAIPVRHRQMAALTERAKAYLAHCPPAEPRFKDTATRVKRASPQASPGVQYLLIPQAKILVAVADDLLRIFLVNALTSEGHQVAERKDKVDFVRGVEQERPQVVILDLEGASYQLPELREASDTRIRTVIVCSPDGKSTQTRNALLAGANDWMPRPPHRDLLNEKVQACQGLLGRRIHLPPSLRSERRASPRTERKGGVGLKDPLLGKPLAVPSADLMDASAGGLRIDYNRPAWPLSWTYTGHGVHPNHYLYSYAVENPLAHDLTVNFPGPRNEALERKARVVHVSSSEDLEIVGLQFNADPDAPAAPPKRMF